jgi:hypothetical protein
MGEPDAKGKHSKDSIMSLVLAQLKHWHKIEEGDKPKKKNAKKKKKTPQPSIKQE